ncbi:hypothetical protein [Paraburkholderia caballeronis]|uniref:Uncharacterized protein n=1 Tax=Paraburkholderia caballeronis TaxID=416943 RepID=A0A1H7TZY7_9BURK|nr:hypothetical protein [Paraburkholderia caballeronis]PXW23422.1 hypothetical protein C7403_110160 [Paraburkholderia caballeronis]PXW98415.1 hypothetical protein C7407_110160 [Paraburkholderia caballeronis]RAJ95146.1 hypothetical protein C7409_110161 [Paraburkholderia caballeronis]SEC54383.1 hypothetical protein SAMN05445871_2400 [Paraburkholderia caballeronis]SEL90114.1 hypothetical protein SAMN05192542_11750 [Paraburkholderia caballeronis]
MTDEIDPIEFGRMLARVEAQGQQLAELRAENQEMRTDIKRLLEMANQGRGSLFVLMGIGSLVGGVLIEASRYIFFGGR